MLKNSNSKILIMIKLYNYLSRQRRAYFFFSLNFVSQRMRKEKKISRIRCLKIGLLGRKIGFYEAHPNCSFLYSFFPALAIRGPNFSRYYRAGRASIRVLSASRFLLRLSPNRTRSRSLCARVSPGRRRFFSAFPGDVVRDDEQPPRAVCLVISREIVFGAPEQFRGPPRVSENILPSKFTRKSTSSSPLFFFLERNCLLYLIRRDGTSSISSKLVSR